MAALRAGGAAEGPVSGPSPEGGPGCCVPGPVPGVFKAHVSEAFMTAELVLNQKTDDKEEAVLEGLPGRIPSVGDIEAKTQCSRRSHAGAGRERPR